MFFSSPEHQQQYVDVAGRYARYTRCLSNCPGANALKLLTGLGGKGMDRGVVKLVSNADILQTLYLVGYLALTLYVALILDEYLSAFNDLLAPGDVNGLNFLPQSTDIRQKGHDR